MGDNKKAAELILKIDREELNQRGDEEGNTALHIATILNNNEICERILTRSPEASKTVNKNGLTELHFANMAGQKDVYEMIIKKDPQAIYAIDKKGLNVQNYANLGGNKEIILSILDKLPMAQNHLNLKELTPSSLKLNSNHQLIERIIELSEMTPYKFLFLQEIIKVYPLSKDITIQIHKFLAEIVKTQTFDLKGMRGTDFKEFVSQEISFINQRIIQPSLISESKDFKTSEIIGLKHQSATENLEKNCGTPEKFLNSLIQQNQREETMSKQITRTQSQQETTNIETANKTLSVAERLEKKLELLDQIFQESADSDSLDLSHLELSGDSCVEKIADFLKQKSTITALNLSHSHTIGNDWAKLIANYLKDNTSLTHLDLSYNEIRGGVWAQQLESGLSTNSTLKTLNLSNNKVGGYIWFTKLDNITSGREVDLTNNPINMDKPFYLNQSHIPEGWTPSIDDITTVGETP